MSLPPPSPIASAMKRGRPKDDFTFEQFSAPVIPGGKKTAVVHCKHCNKKSSYLVRRCRDHLRLCNKFCSSLHPPLFTNFMVQYAYADESTVVATCGKDYRLSLSFLPSTPITTPPSSPRQQISIGSFTKKMSNNKKKAIDYTNSKYMHVNGGSYSLFKSPHGKAVIQALSPAYMQAGGPPSTFGGISLAN